jgi:hypothetical protein
MTLHRDETGLGLWYTAAGQKLYEAAVAAKAGKETLGCARRLCERCITPSNRSCHRASAFGAGNRPPPSRYIAAKQEASDRL